MTEKCKNPESDGSQEVFRALADPTRREILKMLSEREMSIAEVAGRFKMTRAAVRKHLTVLEQGRLISVHPRGRETFSRLEPAALNSAAVWLSYFDRFWDKRLEDLKTAVDTHMQQQSEERN